MERYIVSARKYRPVAFGEVVGQKALTTTLRNAILSKRIGHAYLFCGPRGVGKTTCARIFAKMVNCEHPDAEGNPCNECESCRAFDEGRSMNIYELDAASHNKVDDIRDLIEQVAIPPQIGKYKVFIIDEVHMLSTQAFNAFLKTLEEPPAHAVFIMATTEKQKLLPTIISRCQIYDFNRMEVPDIVAHLKEVAAKEGIEADDEALTLIAVKADGGMRDALSIFDQVSAYAQGKITYQAVLEDLNVLDYDYYFRMVDHLLKKEIPESLLLLNDILSRGFGGGYFVSGLADHVRNLLVASDAASLPLLPMSDDAKKRYADQASRCSKKFLYRALKICNACDVQYRNSGNKRLLVELTLIELAQCADEDDPSSGLGPTKHILKPVFGQQPAPSTPNKTYQAAAAAPARAAQEPAARVAPQPAAPPQPARPRTVSLRQTAQTAAAAPAANNASAAGAAANYGNKAVSEADVSFCWMRFAQSLPKADTALSKRMEIMVPHLEGGTIIRVDVNSEHVVSDLRAIEGRLTEFFRRELQNGALTFQFGVSENAETLGLAPKELFKEMLDQSEPFRALNDFLHLELI